MRARIIFQGLTLFTFDEPTANAPADAKRKTLTALLVSNPEHDGHPLHKHTPRMGVNGRDEHNENQVWKSALRHVPKASTTVQLEGHGSDTGVTLDGSFIDYVPCLSQLHWKKSSGKILEDHVMARIVISSGTVRARNFIGWDWHGNTAARIGYMGTAFQGFGANEVVVDMGDDDDFGGHDSKRFLSVTGPGVDERLWPRVKGQAADEDMDPNTVEVVFTNFPARRLRPAPHGLHFETVCDAAGYPRDPGRYVDTDQYKNFANAMQAYDKVAWDSDVEMMRLGHPFPYLINPKADLREPLSSKGEFPKDVDPQAVIPPPAAGRPPAGKGPELGGPDLHKDHGGGTGDDPDNTLICPHGRE